VEVLETIFRELNIEVVSKSIGNWKRCLSTVKDGRTDLLIAAFSTDERMQYAKFTQTPLSADPSAIFVWKERQFEFNKWEDLIGKRAGLILGDSHGQEFDLFLKKHAAIQYVSRRFQNYKKLELNRIDFEPSGLYTGLIEVKKYGYGDKIIALKKPFATNYLYIAISNKSKYLSYLAQIESGLQKLHENGSIDRLIKKYTDYYIATTTDDGQ
jgi:polar amino acid transport system substrate-binding protein